MAQKTQVKSLNSDFFLNLRCVFRLPLDDLQASQIQPVQK